MKELTKLCKLNNINFSEKYENNFSQFFNDLIYYNNMFNLTAITEKNEVIIKHFLDSIYPEKYIPKNASVIDIGAGAGFPSLPLKIVREDLNLTMLDSLNKRVNFLNNMVEKLDLKNAFAIHSRAEDYAIKNREKFDIAIARAVANLSTLSEYCLPFVKVGGTFIAMKGGSCEEEINNAKLAIKTLGGKIDKVEEYNLEGNSRTIIIIKKIMPTPNKYPRGKNFPKTKPIGE